MKKLLKTSVLSKAIFFSAQTYPQDLIKGNAEMYTLYISFKDSPSDCRDGKIILSDQNGK